jgi:hypothetical protein
MPVEWHSQDLNFTGMKPLRITWMFWLRLGIVLFGLLVAAPGMYAWIHGNYWYIIFDRRFGRWSNGPTVMLIFFGLMIVLFGLFSNGWESISPAEQKRFDRNWQKKHRSRK